MADAPAAPDGRGRCGANAVQHRDPRKRYAAHRRLEERLRALCRPYAADPSAAQLALRRRIMRHIEDMFVFVADPLVPPDNNRSERSLRPLVVSRKGERGTRSARGTETRITLA